MSNFIDTTFEEKMSLEAIEEAAELERTVEGIKRDNRRRRRAGERTRRDVRRKNLSKLFISVLTCSVVLSLAIASFGNQTPSETSPESTPVVQSIRIPDEWDMPLDTEKNSGFKSFTDYRMITNAASEQYLLQKDAVTNPDTGIREVSGKPLVAVGSYFNASIGQEFILTLEDGSRYTVVIGDIKADKDTDTAHLYSEGGVIITFIVDDDVISADCLRSGDMSSAGYDGQVLRLAPAVQ